MIQGIFSRRLAGLLKEFKIRLMERMPGAKEPRLSGSARTASARASASGSLLARAPSSGCSR